MYRHWAGKLELVGDAVTTLKQQVQAPDTDDHRERITGLIRAIAGHLAESRFSACMPALVGPLFLRRLTTAEPFPVEQVDDLVAMVLDPYWQT